MITKDDILALGKVQDATCASIFIPTHRSGEAVINGKDSIVLKNELKAVKQQLEQKGMSEKEAEQFVAPATALLEDESFWKNQSDGLAVFLTKDKFEKYTVPVNFDAYSYVSNEFYIKPLVPMLNRDQLFYVLTLTPEEIKMYEGTPHSITSVKIDDVIPTRMEDRVGYDHEQESTQFRTQQGNDGSGIFHGHGKDNQSTHKSEMLEFFKAVDNGVIKIIGDDQNIPLVIAGLDVNTGIYKEANHYEGLLDKTISGNPKEKDVYLLHEEAVALLQPYFDKQKNSKAEALASVADDGKASSDLNEVLNKTLQGLVDTAFINSDAEVYGTYDMTNQQVNIEQEHTADNVSLLNLVATKVLEYGGNVHLVEGENMPLAASDVNALYRG